MAEALWEWAALVSASGGAADGSPDVPVTGFSLDTRTLAAGEVFVALKDQRDGHEFVSAAFARGAAAALVSETYVRKPGDGALLRVPDVLGGLERIGIAARARLAATAKVIAVTGSAGKTGTKEMLRVCLARAGRTHAPDKSFNNHWGVPLTLARMPAGTEFGVFEIGMNHAGEIRPLSGMVRPHVAIITNVLPVHIGNFPEDGEVGIAKAKAEIFEGLVTGGVAILPADSAHAGLLAAAARTYGARICGFGRGAGANARATAIDGDSSGSTITVGLACGDVSYRLGIPGEHVASNSVAVAAAIDAAGASLALTLPALAQIGAGAGRGQRVALAAPDGGAMLLIDESYNANPASMAAAIRTAAAARSAKLPRLVIVIGDMLELGENAVAYHTGLKGVIEDSRVDTVLGCGSATRHLLEALPQSRQGAWAIDSAALVAPVLAALRSGDVVMVKGSLGSRMAPIVDAIKKRFAADAGSV